MEYIEDQIFTRIDYGKEQMPITTFERRTYDTCRFSNADLSKFRFLDCEFINCNLSSVKLFDTSFQNVKFRGCKLLGLYFENCGKLNLSFSFHDCILNNTSFYQVKTLGTEFSDSQLKEVDFTECDLAQSVFMGCDLYRTIFDTSNIEGADFRSSFNYMLEPEKNRIRKAKFSLEDIQGLLHHHDIEIEGWE